MSVVQAQSLELLCALTREKRGDQPLAQISAQPGFQEVFFEQLHWHQLAPLIDQSIDWVSDCLIGNVGDEVARIKMQLAANALKHTKETIWLVEQFAAAGIRVVNLKGPALSQQLYGTPIKRHTRDIDLLVSIEDVPEATRRLMEMGYICEFSEFQRPGFYSQYTFLSKDVSFHHPGKDILIELHWRLMNNPELMPIDFEDAWRTREEVMLGDSAVTVLGSVNNALYLACHGSIAHWARLKWVADWQQLLNNNTLDWEQVFMKARSIGKEIYLQNALDNAGYWFGKSSTSMPLQNSRRVASHLLATNRTSQLHCKYPSVTKSAWNRLLMAGSVSATWEEFRRSLGTSVVDIRFCRLPNQLFFLYYLFRPLIYLARKIRTA